MSIKVSKEVFSRALECKTADDLLAFCEKEGLQISKEDAEKFISQASDQELDLNTVNDVAGGVCIGAVSGSFCLGVGI